MKTMKSQRSSTLRKAVTNVKQIIKKKDKETIKNKDKEIIKSSDQETVQKKDKATIKKTDKVTIQKKDKVTIQKKDKVTLKNKDKGILKRNDEGTIKKKEKGIIKKKNTGFIKLQDKRFNKINTKGISKINIKGISKTSNKGISKTNNKGISKINVKEISKTSDKEISKEKDKESTTKVSEKPETKEKNLKPFKSTRGIVYIGHIPYGFFEDEMKEYFEQFGTVTRVRVARSKKTGKSRGYGYIEFRQPDVAKIAAETMNNYLMCGRLLKTTYIPPEKQHRGYFNHYAWSAKRYPRLLNRMKEIKRNESPISDTIYQKKVRRSLRQISALEEKLKSSGINIKFKLADVPK